jgi:hypothetical protein
MGRWGDGEIYRVHAGLLVGCLIAAGPLNSPSLGDFELISLGLGVKR